MKNRVRSQLMQLNPVNKQETTKKLVDGSRKTADKKFGKHYPKSCGWCRSSFITGRCHLVAVAEETQFLQIPMLSIVELGSPPSRDFLLCRRCSSGVGGGATGVLGMSHGRAQERIWRQKREAQRNETKGGGVSYSL